MKAEVAPPRADGPEHQSSHTAPNRRERHARRAATLRKLLVGAGALGICSLAAASASATARQLPFSYPYATLGPRQVELEQYLDFTPVRVERELPDGTREGVFGLRSQFQTELEVGITPRLEGAFYLAFRQAASVQTPSLEFQGVKQRLRYRFAEEGDLPVDLGIYLELAEFHNELELEEKLLLSKRFGAVTVLMNLWVEQEYYFQNKETRFVYNPTLGAAWEISPQLALGLEYWASGRFDRPSTPSPSAIDSSTSGRHYAGPTVFTQTGQIWLSAGFYFRLDELNRAVAVGDPYGRLWIRTLIGVEL